MAARVKHFALIQMKLEASFLSLFRGEFAVVGSITLGHFEVASITGVASFQRSRLEGVHCNRGCIALGEIHL